MPAPRAMHRHTPGRLLPALLSPPVRERLRLGGCIGLSLLLHLLVLLGHLPSAAPPPPARPALPEKFIKLGRPAHRLLARRAPPPPVTRPVAQRSPAAAPAQGVPAPLATALQPGALGHIGIPSVSMLPAQTPFHLLPMSVSSRPVGGRAGAGRLGGSRSVAQAVDLSSELLAVESFDTGRHRAVVVMDPRDSRNLRGYVQLSAVYSSGLEAGDNMPKTTMSGDFPRSERERRALHGLAAKVSEHSGVHAEVRDAVALDSPELLAVPFVLITVTGPFQYSPAEAANLGRYLTGGGFLYAEVVGPAMREYSRQDLEVPQFKAMIAAGLRTVGMARGKDWSFSRLAPDHPLYHSFHSFDGLPRGYRDIKYWYHSADGFTPTPDYLEGILVGGRVAGIYSCKGYSEFWGGEAERIRERDSEVINLAGGFAIGGEEVEPYKLGVNVLVYALTREGSLAQQFVAVK